MLRDDRLVERERFLEVLHGARPGGEPFENADAGGMREGAEEVALEDLQRRGHI